jgi:hypothetical protein
MGHTKQLGKSHPARDRLLLIVFWAYVSVPLAWGVYSTLMKAMALFR